MADIIEILFENIDLEELSKLLKEIVEESNLVNYQISVDNTQTKEKAGSLSNLIENFAENNEGSLYMNFEEFRLENILLPKVGIQILKYGECVDLSIDIDYKYFKKLESLKSVQKWAEIKSNQISAKSYCCGYEPASDCNTRFFTNDEMGPLGHKKENM